MPLPSDLGSNYHIHICVQTCTCIYCHCFKCFPLKQFDVPYYRINHSKGNFKQNNGFIPFLYNGTYFKCIEMRYITARDAVGTMMPKKIISKTCLKIIINKEFKSSVQLPKKLTPIFWEWSRLKALSQQRCRYITFYCHIYRCPIYH